MTDRDAVTLAAIDSGNVEQQWSAEDFRSLRQEFRHVHVAERDELLGYLVTDWPGAHAYIRRLVIRENLRRQGIGTILVKDELLRLSVLHVEKVSVLVCENNLPAQCFFRSLHFLWVKTSPGCFALEEEESPTSLDGYVMQCVL